MSRVWPSQLCGKCVREQRSDDDRAHANHATCDRGAAPRCSAHGQLGTARVSVLESVSACD